MKNSTKKRATKRPVAKTTKTTSKKTTSKKPVKTTSKKTTSKPKTAPKKTTTKATTKSQVILKKNGKDNHGNTQYSAVKVYSRKPAGWKESKSKSSAPKGYKHIHNGKKAGKRREGFIKA